MFNNSMVGDMLQIEIALKDYQELIIAEVERDKLIENAAIMQDALLSISAKSQGADIQTKITEIGDIAFKALTKCGYGK